MRHQLTGSKDDLDRTIDIRGEALVGLPPRTPGYVEVMDENASFLFTRFILYHDDEDLDRAIALREQVLQCTAVDDSERPFRLIQLAESLRARHARGGKPEDNRSDLVRAEDLEERANTALRYAK